MSKDALAKPPEGMSPQVQKAFYIIAKSGFLGYLLGMATQKVNDVKYNNSVKLNFILGLAIVLLLCICWHLITVQPDPRVVGLTPDLRVIELIPLDKDHADKVDVSSWAAKTITKCLSLSFLHFNQQLAAQNENFFDGAFQEFLASLETSGILPAIRGDGGASAANSMATLTAPAIVTAKALIDGVVTWRVEFPIIINFELRSGGTVPQRRMAVVIAQRVPISENPRGVKIKRVNLEYN